MGRATYREIPGLIYAREDFEGNSMSAENIQNGKPSLNTIGQLPHNWEEQFYADRDNGIWYVVYSYSTPIAWLTSSGEYKHVVIPDVKYSVTTSKHQSKARQGFGDEYPIVKHI